MKNAFICFGLFCLLPTGICFAAPAVKCDQACKIANLQAQTEELKAQLLVSQKEALGYKQTADGWAKLNLQRLQAETNKSKIVAPPAPSDALATTAINAFTNKELKLVRRKDIVEIVRIFYGAN